jgi:hypothetical protein
MGDIGKGKNIEIVGWRVFLTRKYLLKNKRK